MALLQDVPEHSDNNPLDMMEEIVSANAWRYDRSSNDEMIVEIAGNWCDYRLFFVWEENLSALCFSCLSDLTVTETRTGPLAELLMLANERLWIGHFDLCSDEKVPMFRHTMLLRGAEGATLEQLEDLMEAAIGESDRYYPAFRFVLRDGRTPAEAIDAALLDTEGEA